MAKFVEEFSTDEWEVYTPSGWQSFRGIGKTIEYAEWVINTETKSLICADDHILFNEKGVPTFCKDLKTGQSIQTIDGLEKVLSVENTSVESNMYDLTDVDDGNVYYTNGILSHNSTTVVSYLLHYAIFNDNVNIAVLANKASTARDILNRLQTGYENLPKWLQQGVSSWNKGSMELENGSKIVAASTSASSVRGGTYNIIFLDEFAFVPQQVADNFMSSVYPTITSGKETKIIIVSCVTKDTYLLTDKGYRRIETLIDKSKTGAYIIPEYTVRGNDKFYSSTIVVNQPKSVTNIIKTRYETLECSENHYLWAFKNGKYDYVKSKDLSVGDYITIKYNQQIFGNEDAEIDEYMAQEMGIYISKDESLPEENIILNNALREVLLKPCEDRFLPDEVLSWSKKNILALISGIFTIGGIVTDNSIRISIYSKELSRQLQLLLANLGIIGTIKEHKTQKLGYEITITGKFATKFFNLIKIDSKKSYQHSGIFIEESIDDLILGTVYCLNDSSSEDLIWIKINDIEKSENEVFDVSLPDIDGDDWAHSVLYNNFLGHQTPNGMNQFYKLWDDAIKQKNKYIPTRVYWQDVPGRDEKFKQETIANMGQQKWDAEFECHFLGSSDTLISGQKLGNLVTDPPIRTEDLLDIFEDPIPGNIYLITVDVAEGVELDYSVFIVFDVTQIPYRVVAKYRNNDIPSLRFPDVIEPIGRKYNNAYILCEVNNDSQVANILYTEYAYPNVLQTKTLGRGGQVAGQNFSGKGVKYGIKMSKPVKRAGCLNLKTFIEEDKLLFHDRDIVEELTTFVSRYNSFSAEEGKNDDLVACLILFAWVCTQDYFKEMTETDIRKKIREEHEQKLEDEDALPLGYISSNDIIPKNVDQIDEDGTVWFTVNEDEDFSFFWNYNY